MTHSMAKLIALVSALAITACGADATEVPRPKEVACPNTPVSPDRFTDPRTLADSLPVHGTVAGSPEYGKIIAYFVFTFRGRCELLSDSIAIHAPTP